jgi:hypothetical protein
LTVLWNRTASSVLHMHPEKATESQQTININLVSPAHLTTYLKITTSF